MLENNQISKTDLLSFLTKLVDQYPLMPRSNCSASDADRAARIFMLAFSQLYIYLSLRSSSLSSKLAAGTIWKIVFLQFLKQRIFLYVSKRAMVSAKPLAVRKPRSSPPVVNPLMRIPCPYIRWSACQSLDIDRYVNTIQFISANQSFFSPNHDSHSSHSSNLASFSTHQYPQVVLYRFLFNFQIYRSMHKHLDTYHSAKIGVNLLWSEPLHSLDNQEFIGVEKKVDNCRKEVKEIAEYSSPTKKEEEALDLQDLWNALGEGSQEQQQTNPVKISMVNISNEPCSPQTLTLEELEEVFGVSNSIKESPPKQQPQQPLVVEDVEDFNDLWEQISEDKEEEKHKSLEKLPLKQKQPIQALQFNQSPKSPDFFQIQEKEQDRVGKLALILGKNFQVYNYTEFLLSCFQKGTYSYFGFEQTKPNNYNFFDLTTNKSMITCTIEKYDDYGQSKVNKKKIVFETDYCLKIRLTQTKELMATIWKKTICSGILFNVREYNGFEQKYQDSMALIEVADGYIGNFCFCNTNTYLSQKYSKELGPFKMKLSLKGGFLIAHMGVSGIKSAPYNCRLQNPNNSFIYLLGMIQKSNDRFIVRVGQGMSPLVSFAISIGRKRYIDSFKE